MTKLLLFIKHRLPFVWRAVDWLNALLFRIFHGNKLRNEAERCSDEFQLASYRFRALGLDDLQSLHQLLSNQPEVRLEHFNPHEFDMGSLERVYKNPSFLMFGVFDGAQLVGYFFLRCFWNRREQRSVDRASKFA